MRQQVADRCWSCAALLLLWVLLTLAPLRALALPPMPTLEKARSGTQCVLDAATMRRQHPVLLRHQRDATVHQGERGTRLSLQGCVACHASASTGSVAAAQQDFCVACHRYAAVRIDCFECHASRPERAAGAAP